MARIYPFRALRYDTSKVRMEDVVTQPYDKISPEMQQAYYDRSPYNLIRVILGKREPGDTDPYAPGAAGTPQHNVYTRAAESLARWRAEGILREESEPALYGYSQTYEVPGSIAADGRPEVRERRGFIALGHLYDYAEQVVYRHEQTFPKHKSDRLALFKATRAYCEQIYMLYSDPAFTAEKLIFDDRQPGAQGTAVEGHQGGRPADLTITDEYGVVHRVWKLTDPHLINLIVSAMADKKLIIADGHHRYETSVAYMQERKAQLQASPTRDAADEDPEEEESPSNRADEPHVMLPRPAFPEAAMMMTFVNMNAPGITILPTHRVVFGLKDFDTQTFLKAAGEFFEVKPLDSADVRALAATEGTAMIAATRDGSWMLAARPEAVAHALAQPQRAISARQARLDVVQLHRLLLEGVLGLSHESIANLDNLRYVRDANEAAAQVRDGRADIAFLIKPVTLAQLNEISLANDVMPQKSTDFYPKLLSGLAMYALDAG